MLRPAHFPFLFRREALVTCISVTIKIAKKEDGVPCWSGVNVGRWNQEKDLGFPGSLALHVALSSHLHCRCTAVPGGDHALASLRRRGERWPTARRPAAPRRDTGQATQGLGGDSAGQAAEQRSRLSADVCDGLCLQSLNGQFSLLL